MKVTIQAMAAITKKTRAKMLKFASPDLVSANVAPTEPKAHNTGPIKIPV